MFDRAGFGRGCTVIRQEAAMDDVRRGGIRVAVGILERLLEQVQAFGWKKRPNSKADHRHQEKVRWAAPPLRRV